MDETKLNRSLENIADSIDSGYSALFTFTVKEYLSVEEKAELSQKLRKLASTQNQHLK